MRIKKITIGFLIMVNILAVSNIVFADNEISIGKYIQLGSYNNEPIIWKCADIDDENGILMLSDKILCFKAYDVGVTNLNVLVDRSKHQEFGSGFWEESQIRAWLNATEVGGNIEWPSGYSPTSVWGGSADLAYDTEDGFISWRNFTNSELNVIKTVSQWQILASADKDLSTNGVSDVFQSNALIYGDGRGDRGFLYSDVTELNHVEGAMYRVSDTVFLPDVRQIYRLWSNFGSVAAVGTELAENQSVGYGDSQFGEKKHNRYCLRTPSGNSITYVYGDIGYDAHMAACPYGIRPAFYLNEKNYQILSGSGTEYDPYIVGAKFEQESAAVFSQGEQLEFDQEPIEENGRLLVPMRAVFESLGAEVTYDDGDGVITATNDERTVVLQIDNHEMGNGTEVIILDAVPKIVGNRTLVPLRAVAEAFDCDVEYIENLNRVVIDKPKLPMDFGEGVGSEDWQQDWYKEVYLKSFR